MHSREHADSRYILCVLADSEVRSLSVTNKLTHKLHVSQKHANIAIDPQASEAGAMQGI